MQNWIGNKYSRLLHNKTSLILKDTLCTSRSYKGKLGARKEINQVYQDYNWLLKDFCVWSNLTKISSISEETNRQSNSIFAPLNIQME